MQSIICRGCCSQVESSEKAKDIFANELLPGPENLQSDQIGLPEEKILTISSGLELVVGYSVSKTDGISPYLCDECTKKLTTYVNFRKQLLSSRKLLIDSKDSRSTCNNIVEPCTVNSSDLSSNNSDDTGIEKREFINNTENTETKLDTLDQQSSPDNLNVDDNSISSGFTDSPELENDTRDAGEFKEDNNNLNEPEASNSSPDIHISEANDFKNQIHDVESDIDVCSGEDDDVLELDIPSKKNETIEIGSSSESEIEVCDNDGDYIPRIKCTFDEAFQFF